MCNKIASIIHMQKKQSHRTVFLNVVVTVNVREISLKLYKCARKICHPSDERAYRWSCGAHIVPKQRKNDDWLGGVRMSGGVLLRKLMCRFAFATGCLHDRHTYCSIQYVTYMLYNILYTRIYAVCALFDFEKWLTVTFDIERITRAQQRWELCSVWPEDSNFMRMQLFQYFIRMENDFFYTKYNIYCTFLYSLNYCFV